MYNVLKKKLNNKLPIRDSLMRSETATYIRLNRRLRRVRGLP